MTIFTKSDTIDEKKDIETGKEIPKVGFIKLTLGMILNLTLP